MSRDKDYVHDVVESFELAIAYLGRCSVTELAGDREKLDAIIRRIEIVGEATKRLSQELRAANPQVPWREMAGMRDRVIHGYDRLDVPLIYRTVSERMPELVEELRRLRDTLPDSD